MFYYMWSNLIEPKMLLTIIAILNIDWNDILYMKTTLPVFLHILFPFASNTPLVGQVTSKCPKTTAF